MLTRSQKNQGQTPTNPPLNDLPSEPILSNPSINPIPLGPLDPPKEDPMPSWAKALLDGMRSLNIKFDLQEIRIQTLENNNTRPNGSNPTQKKDKGILEQPFEPLKTHDSPTFQNTNSNNYSNNRERIESHYNQLKLDTPMFKGGDDPKEYLNWESHLDSYFAWFNYSEERKLMFAELRLDESAKTY